MSARAPARAAATPERDVWRKSTPAAAPATPTRETAAAPVEGKYRPGAFGSGAGGWRAREAAKKEAEAAGGSGAATPVRSESPAPRSPALAPAREETKKDDDGFQTVPSKGVWRPKRGGRP
jgi:translation initiation factor 3 subunit A